MKIFVPYITIAFVCMILDSSMIENCSQYSTQHSQKYFFNNTFLYNIIVNCRPVIQVLLTRDKERHKLEKIGFPDNEE